MKKIICTTIILLTFSFVFASEKIYDNKKLLNTRPITFSQNNLTNTNIVLSVSYDVSTFCANSKGISTPTVSEAGGVFKSIRTSTGNGGLALNPTTGKIDRFISNAGTYEIVYTIGTISVKTILTVTSCN